MTYAPISPRPQSSLRSGAPTGNERQANIWSPARLAQVLCLWSRSFHPREKRFQRRHGETVPSVQTSCQVSLVVSYLELFEMLWSRYQPWTALQQGSASTSYLRFLLLAWSQNVGLTSNHHKFAIFIPHTTLTVSPADSRSYRLPLPQMPLVHLDTRQHDP